MQGLSPRDAPNSVGSDCWSGKRAPFRAGRVLSNPLHTKPVAALFADLPPPSSTSRLLAALRTVGPFLRFVGERFKVIGKVLRSHRPLIHDFLDCGRSCRPLSGSELLCRPPAYFFSAAASTWSRREMIARECSIVRRLCSICSTRRSRSFLASAISASEELNFLASFMAAPRTGG